MKRVTREIIDIAMYTLFGVILIMSSYMILINVRHQKALSMQVVVSEADIDYSEYKKTINDIEDVLNKHSNTNDKLFIALNNTLSILKNDGVFRLLPKSRLEYHDLYELNDYFINSIINNCWFSQLNLLNKNTSFEQEITLLTSSSQYLNSFFIDNGLSLYDSSNKDRIIDSYQAILKNYVSFAKIILAISANLGG